MFNRAKWRECVSIIFAAGMLSAALAQSTGCNHGLGKAINDVQDLEDEVEKRNQEIDELLP